MWGDVLGRWSRVGLTLRRLLLAYYTSALVCDLPLIGSRMGEETESRKSLNGAFLKGKFSETAPVYFCLCLIG